MQRGCLDDPTLPGVRDERNAVLLGERRDPQQLGDPAAPGDVGLDQVDVAALDQLAEAPAVASCSPAAIVMSTVSASSA